MDAADPDKRGNMKLMDQGREADNEFEEGKSVSLISSCHFFLLTWCSWSISISLLSAQGNKNKENHGETNGEASEPMDTSSAGN